MASASPTMVTAMYWGASDSSPSNTTSQVSLPTPQPNRRAVSTPITPSILGHPPKFGQPSGSMVTESEGQRPSTNVEFSANPVTKKGRPRGTSFTPYGAPTWVRGSVGSILA